MYTQNAFPLTKSYSTRPRREDTTPTTEHAVLDLFAGTGVGVALKSLGVKEYGVEIMPEAVATRTANGMETVYNDVWDAHLAEDIDFDTLWASPPCQTFSMAGAGAGRKALDNVLGIIERKQYVDMTELREQSALLGDERIGLVLSPLHYAARFLPTYLAFEQVPPVLPVWQAMAVELREMGYSVWTGLLHAEQYGVPQTRKRAILMARRDGVEAQPPVPTHSKYYTTDPERVDAGVKKWVTMFEALGRGLPRPSPTITGGGTETGGAEPIAKISRYINRPDWSGARERLSTDEAAALQTYPTGWGWTNRPAPTVLGAGVHGASGVELFDRGSRAKMLAGIEAGTFIGNGRVVNPNTPLDPLRLHPSESAALQTYPAAFQFSGNKGKQFLQIGNAVPVLLAQAVIESVWSPAP